MDMATIKVGIAAENGIVLHLIISYQQHLPPTPTIKHNHITSFGLCNIWGR